MDTMKVQPPVSYYLRRSNENDLKARLQDDRLLVVAGMAGSGKRQLCQSIIGQLVPEGGETKTIEVDVNSVTQESLNNLMQELGDPNHRINLIFFSNVTSENFKYVVEVIHRCRVNNIMLFVIATKDPALFPGTYILPKLTIDECKHLFQTLRANIRNSDLDKIETECHGSPLAVVCAAKHMSYTKSSFNQYLKDSDRGCEKINFIEMEYGFSYNEAIDKDIKNVFRKLNDNEMRVVFCLAYMKEPLPIDLLESIFNIRSSQIAWALQCESFADVYIEDGERLVSLHPVLISRLKRFDETRYGNLKTALFIVNTLFCKDVRFEDDQRMQDLLNKVAEHLVDNEVVKLDSDFETDLLILQLNLKRAHVNYCKGSIVDAKNQLFECLQIFNKIFLNPGRIQTNLNNEIQMSVCREEDSALVCHRLCKQLAENCMTDDEKQLRGNAIYKNVTFQKVSADNVAHWIADLNKRDRFLNFDLKVVSPKLYEYLARNGYAVKRSTVISIFPYELLATILYSLGKCYFKNFGMHKKLAKQYLDLSRHLCEFVSRTFNVNLLVEMLCHTKGILRLMFCDDIVMLDDLAKCKSAIEIFDGYFTSNKDFCEFGLLKDHKGMSSCDLLHFVRRGLKDPEILQQSKNLISKFSTELQSYRYSRLHKCKTLIAMAKLAVEIGRVCYEAIYYNNAHTFLKTLLASLIDLFHEGRTLVHDHFAVIEESLTLMTDLLEGGKIESCQEVRNWIDNFKELIPVQPGNYDFDYLHNLLNRIDEVAFGSTFVSLNM